MSDSHATPSAPDDFGAARQILTLPVPGPNGNPLRIRIEAATMEELVPMVQAIPGAGRDTRADEDGDPLALTLDFLARYGDKARPIVDRWVISPRISFDGPKPGHIEWQKLHLQNRLAIINGITVFAQTGSVGVAGDLATFPAQQPGGTGDGRGAGRTVAVRDPAAPYVETT